MRHTYSSEDQVCLSCHEDADDEDEADNDADDVNEMCENVYQWAAKCESKTGLEGGFVQVNRDEDDYENQVENEFMACTFIDSLIWDSYTESGEINWEDTQDVGTYASVARDSGKASHSGPITFHSTSRGNTQARYRIRTSCSGVLVTVWWCLLL